MPAKVYLQSFYLVSSGQETKFILDQKMTMCRMDASRILCNSQILTSDDVTDYLLDMRHLNDGIDNRRTELMDDYTDRKHKELLFASPEDYDEWKESYDAKRLSKSRFVRQIPVSSFGIPIHSSQI